MANRKISELATATTPDGSELVEIVQGGVNKKTTTRKSLILEEEVVVRLILSTGRREWLSWMLEI